MLQLKVTKATVKDMTQANAVVKKAKAPHFKHFDKKSSWRLVVNHDASSASKGRAYSHKGVMVLLMPDYINYDPRIHTISGKKVKESCFGGVGHILSAHEPKAKRISYSIRLSIRMHECFCCDVTECSKWYKYNMIFLSIQW